MNYKFYFNSIKDAKCFYDRVVEIAKDYDTVRLSDLCDLAGELSDYLANKVIWTKDSIISDTYYDCDNIDRYYVKFPEPDQYPAPARKSDKDYYNTTKPRSTVKSKETTTPEPFNTFFTNPAYKEILKLDTMLTEGGIPHELDRNRDGWQVFYPSRECKVMDAIEHFDSYGNGVDLLEIMGLLTPDEEQVDSVVGCLTAEEVFERIRKYHNGEWNDYIKSLSTDISEDEHPENITLTPHTMTPEEFKQAMADAIEYGVEDDHLAMDDIMCNLLRSLGYGEGIDIFENTDKWYG